MVETLTRSVADRIASEGGEFGFVNALSLAAGDKWIINPKDRVDSMGTAIPSNTYDYLPFDAVTIDNFSNEKIRAYINSAGISSTARSFPLARLGTKTYDLTRVTSITIVNEGASSIAAEEINVLFQRLASNTDAIAEAIIRKIPSLGRRPLINDDRRFL